MSDFECICTTTAQCAYHADLTKLAADSKTATPDPWVKQSCIPTPEALAEAIANGMRSRDDYPHALLDAVEPLAGRGLRSWDYEQIRPTEENVKEALVMLADVIRHAMEQKGADK